MKTEPVYAHSAILTLLQAAIPFAVLMGWFELSNDQFAALMIFANALLVFVLALATRNIVWSPASHEAVVTKMETKFNEAFYAPGHPASAPSVETTVTHTTAP